MRIFKDMYAKRVIAGLLIVLIGSIIFFFLAEMDDTASLREFDRPSIPPVSSSEHVYGSSTSAIVLIEYYDLECPYCKRLHEGLPRDFLDSIGYVYRPFPLIDLHTGTAHKALIALCAEEIDPQYLLRVMDYAYDDLGQSAEMLIQSLSYELPQIERLKECVSRGDYKEEISQHVAIARVGGIYGTPTVVLTYQGKPLQVFQLVGPGFVVRMIEAFQDSLK